MIIKKEIPLYELDINMQEAFRYAGVKGEADENLHKLYSKAYKILAEYAKPKAVYTPVNLQYTENGVIIEGEKIESLGLKKFLKGDTDIALMAATAGIEADRLINRYSMVEPSLALMLDALSAAAVEALCNKLCNGCFGVEEQRRFSPGYGDFPIEYQKRITEILNTPLNIGVTLTNSMMLTPSKSVTAVVPIKG